MKFIGTRGTDEKKSFSEVILNPAAPNGGLYSPETLPTIDEEFINSTTTYKDLAKRVLKKFEIDIEDELLDEALSLYESNFDNGEAVPVVKVDENLSIAELWHGPTRAFKDMALQPFGVVLSSLAKKRGENYLILAATSGDTGPATLETFKNREFVKVACMYPDNGTSDVQRLQMVTIDANNEKVLGIDGNFDDTQNALKALLNSKSFRNSLKENNISLSAANSVNFGRIIFQTIYHIWAYAKLIQDKEIKFGEKINLVVPSGNFGNALGGYYAKKMGLPIAKIVIASNSNSVLTDFIKKGVYDLNKEVIKTASPAMDILKSSNVERVLFDKFGSDRTKELFEELETNGIYKLSDDELAKLAEDFDATYSTDEECFEYIKEYASKNYLMDTHTATAIKYYKNNPSIKTVAYSTAEWTKFAPSIYKALTGEEMSYDLGAIEYIVDRFGIEVPQMIKELFSKEITQKAVIQKEDIEKTIIEFIKNR